MLVMTFFDGRLTSNGVLFSGLCFNFFQGHVAFAAPDFLAYGAELNIVTFSNADEDHHYDDQASNNHDRYQHGNYLHCYII